MATKGHEAQAVLLPQREEMMAQLRAKTDVMGVTPQTDRFYEDFIGKIAGSRKVGAGLAVAWELASYDTLRDLPPAINVVVGMNFDKVVRAVAPAIAEDAINERNGALSGLERPT